MSSPAMNDYLAKAVLNQLFRTTSFTFPTTMYVALCTTTPVASDNGTTIATSTGTGVEVSGGSYARVNYNPGTGNWSTASGSGDETTSNSNAITFTTATGSWGTITGGGICDNNTTVVSSLTFTNGNATVNMASTTGLNVGDPVYLSHSTDHLSTTIASIVPSTSITLNATWPGTTTSSGTLTDGGNMLFYFTLNSSKTVGSGDVFQFSATNLSVELQ